VVRCTVVTKDGNNIIYEYKKNLPYDVVEKDCTVEVTADWHVLCS